MQTLEKTGLRRFQCGESREKYDAYLTFREESGELGEFEEKYYTADPQWKYMPMLMDFNK